MVHRSSFLPEGTEPGAHRFRAPSRPQYCLLRENHVEEEQARASSPLWWVSASWRPAPSGWNCRAEGNR